MVEVGEEPVKSAIMSAWDGLSSCLPKRGVEKCGESFSDDRITCGKVIALTESLCAENLAWRVWRILCWRVWGSDLGVVLEELGERSRIERAPIDLDRECRAEVAVGEDAGPAFSIAMDRDYTVMCIKGRQNGSRAGRHTIGSWCDVCTMRANEMLDIEIKATFRKPRSTR